ncbi:MAG: hypothetical protein C5B50_14860 [Verrucomicrobia bacterium]|nr:MAG: hypothetical protein C5B50_14860 [Verrucomicrobiota bacterium]
MEPTKHRTSACLFKRSDSYHSFPPGLLPAGKRADKAVRAPTLSPVLLLLAATLISAGGLRAQSFPAGPLPSANAPCAVGVDPILVKAYVVNRLLYSDSAPKGGNLPTDVVSVVDIQSGNILGLIPLPSTVNGLGQDVSVDPTRHRVFVPNYDAKSLSVIDGFNNRMITNITLGASAGRTAVDPYNALIYVGNGSGVTIVGETSNAITGTISLGGPPTVVQVDPSTHRGYAVVVRTVYVLDGVNRAILGSGDIQNLIYTISGGAIDPGRRLWVSDYNTGVLVIMDISHTTPSELGVWYDMGSLRGCGVDPATHLAYAVDAGGAQVSIVDELGKDYGSVPTLSTPSSIAMNSGASRAYVTDAYSDSLTELNLATRKVNRNIGLGSLPTGLCLGSTSGRLYAMNFAADAVSVLNPANQSILTNFSCGPDPWAVAVDESLGKIYCTSAFNASLNTLDLASGQFLNSLTVGESLRVRVSSTTHRVFVTSTNGSGGLTVLQGSNGQVITNITTGLTPVGIALDEAHGRIYVANQHSGTISVIDSSSYQILANWTPPDNNVWGLAIDPALRRLYVGVVQNTVGSFNGVEILNADTGAYITRFSTGGALSSQREAGMVEVNTKTHRAFIADYGGNTLTIIDGTNYLATVPVGNGPNDVAVDETGGLVYVGNVLDGTITVVQDTAVLRIISLKRTGNQASVTWYSLPGTNYQLQAKSRLTDIWTNVAAPIPSTSNLTTQLDSSANSPQRYYRVAIP